MTALSTLLLLSVATMAAAISPLLESTTFNAVKSGYGLLCLATCTCPCLFVCA